MWKAVKAQMSEQKQHQESPENNDDEGFDFTHVNSVARIALYDNLLSAPRVTEIQPAPTGEFIESLATNVYQQSQAAGGTIPYTVIREVSENFIHARFQEATVSILDHGCTIRFADQGPGIACKDRAQLPGFTSAIEPMKSYIRGVGSGLPIVKEYLDFTHGTISIEDNLGTGSVVTISANGSNPQLPKELEIDHVEEDEDAEHPDGAREAHQRGGHGRHLDLEEVHHLPRQRHARREVRGVRALRALPLPPDMLVPPMTTPATTDIVRSLP